MTRDKSLLESITNYYYVGVVPNSCAAINIAATSISLATENTLLAAIYAPQVLWGAYVGYTKYKEYKRVKRAIEKFGWDKRIAKPKMHSWCQRHLAKQAAKKTGHEEEFNRFVESQGYKWYHP